MLGQLYTLAMPPRPNPPLRDPVATALSILGGKRSLCVLSCRTQGAPTQYHHHGKRTASMHDKAGKRTRTKPPVSSHHFPPTHTPPADRHVSTFHKSRRSSVPAIHLPAPTRYHGRHSAQLFDKARTERRLILPTLPAYHCDCHVTSGFSPFTGADASPCTRSFSFNTTSSIIQRVVGISHPWYVRCIVLFHSGQMSSNCRLIFCFRQTPITGHGERGFRKREPERFPPKFVVGRSFPV